MPRLGQPDLGFGVGLRRPHWDQLLDGRDRVDFLEILTENFLGVGGAARAKLREVAAVYPLVLHGTALSIGRPGALDGDYLDALGALIRNSGARWFSDHLCFSSAYGVEYHDLVPLPFTHEAIAHVVERVKQVQQIADVPFLLENPSYYVEFAASQISEAEFVRNIVEQSDCGLLLDINNVYVNASNHGYDARAFIDAMPAERVVQIHMAGHADLGDVIIDTHGAPVIDPVLDLYAYTLARTGPVSTLIEWDNEIPAFDVLLDEVDRVRAAARESV